MASAGDSKNGGLVGGKKPGLVAGDEKSRSGKKPGLVAGDGKRRRSRSDSGSELESQSSKKKPDPDPDPDPEPDPDPNLEAIRVNLDLEHARLVTCVEQINIDLPVHFYPSIIDCNAKTQITEFCRSRGLTGCELLWDKDHLTEKNSWFSISDNHIFDFANIEGARFVLTIFGVVRMHLDYGVPGGTMILFPNLLKEKEKDRIIHKCLRFRYIPVEISMTAGRPDQVVVIDPLVHWPDVDEDFIHPKPDREHLFWSDESDGGSGGGSTDSGGDDYTKLYTNEKRKRDSEYDCSYFGGNG